MRLNRIWQHQLMTLAGIGCLLLLAYTNGNMVDVVPHWLQFLCLYSGIALLIIGLGHGDWHWPSIPRQEILIISGILMVALVLRLWELGTKVRAPVDELLHMSEILALWDNPHLPMISQFGFISSLTRLFASWQAASVAVFGHNLLALRIPSAIVGTLTVGATYFVGRVLFDRNIAVVGALLLATYPPYLQFSRIGILNIGDPLFGTLAFGFMALAFKSNRRMAWILGGVALGLTQYFYEGGRLLYPALMTLYVIFMLLFHRQSIRSWARGLLLWMFTAVMIALPIYYTLAQRSTPLSSRMNTLALTKADWLAVLTSPPSSPAFDFLLRHIVDPFLLFINRPDPTPCYGGSTALILFFLVPAFLLGLFWSIRRANGRGLGLWFLATWAGNLLMVDSALAARYVVVFPAVALIMAVGIIQTVSLLPTQQRFKLAYLYVAVCLVAQTVYYFGLHLEAYNQQLVQGRDAYDVLYRAADLPSGTGVYLVDPPPTMTEDYAQTFLRFLSDDKSIHLIDATHEIDISQSPPASNYTFFVPSDDTTVMPLLMRHFDLQAPQYTSFPLAKDKAYTLYVGVLKS